MNRIYPIGIQNFGEIRKGGYVYVDKTALLYKLIKAGKYYFFGRPHRFGKSLMISTLEAYFEGQKELFKDLAMEKLEKDWNVSPVLHLDLNNRFPCVLQALYAVQLKKLGRMSPSSSMNTTSH